MLCICVSWYLTYFLVFCIFHFSHLVFWCKNRIQSGRQRKRFIVQGNLFVTVHMTINALNLTWQHRTRPHAHMPLHTNSPLLNWKCSVNPGFALASHMTEIECEISTQTFMSADLHYITPVPHHGCRESEQGRNKGNVKEVYMGEKNALQWQIEARENNNKRYREVEKIRSGGSSGWGHMRVPLRLLSLPASQTWLHHSFPVCRYDLTHADGAYAIRH